MSASSGRRTTVFTRSGWLANAAGLMGTSRVEPVQALGRPDGRGGTASLQREMERVPGRTQRAE
jgi:hypothetical protein